MAVRNLGPGATIQTILQKLELLFGSVDPPLKDAYMKCVEEDQSVEKFLNSYRGGSKDLGPP